MTSEPPKRFAGFTLDFGEQALVKGGETLPLTPKAFSVLWRLVSTPGRLVKKDDLLAAAWPDTFVGDSVLKVAIREVRSALGDDARSPRFIETVHRRGYRFIHSLEIDGPQGGTADRSQILVGRDGPLATLRRRGREAEGGRRQIVFVTGEMGIGKTALVDRFLAEIEGNEELLAARGQCLEQFGAGEPYLPVLDALGRLARGSFREELVSILKRHAPTWLAHLPALAAGADQQDLQRETLGAGRPRMLREVAEAIEALCQRRTLVLVLEDLHWSDPSTVDLVSFLARREVPGRLLLIGTSRSPSSRGIDDPFHDGLDDLLAHGLCHRLALERLNSAEVAMYMSSRFGAEIGESALAARLHEQTEGNPLFLLNVADALVGSGLLRRSLESWSLEDPGGDGGSATPETLRRMIERQGERLREEERDVLQTASVCGVEFSVQAVAGGAALSVERAEEICSRLSRSSQFLTPGSRTTDRLAAPTSRFRFYHSLYRSVLYEALPTMRRSRIHLRVAETAERFLGAGAAEIASELASHFEQGGDGIRAIRYHKLAAKRSARRGAHAETVGHLRRALELVDGVDAGDRARERADLFEQVGRIQRSMGEMAPAVESFGSLANAARAEGDTLLEARALLLTASSLTWIEADSKAWVELTRRAVELCRQAGSPAILAHAEGYAGYWRLLYEGWGAEEAAACDRALETSRESGDTALHRIHLGQSSFVAILRGDYPLAESLAADAVELAAATGEAFDFLISLYFLIWARIQAGRWGEASRALRQAIDRSRKNGHRLWLLLFRLQLAWLSQEARDPAAALRLAKICLPEAEAADHPYCTLLALHRTGAASRALGRLDEAEEALARCLRGLARSGVLMGWTLETAVYRELALVAVLKESAGAAAAQADRAVETASRAPDPTWSALAWRTRSLAASVSGDRASAETAIGRARECLGPSPLPPIVWRVEATAASLGGSAVEEAGAAWKRGAGAIRRLAESFDRTDPLRRSLLADPEISRVLDRGPAG